MGFRNWLNRRRRAREIRRVLDDAFHTPELLRSTSLRPGHRNRYVILDHDEEEGELRRIHFGIVRHPRPYAFSRQHHEVLEFYVYDVSAGRIQVVKGINLTREEGLDATE